jgi:hypothetical protein
VQLSSVSLGGSLCSYQTHKLGAKTQLRGKDHTPVHERAAKNPMNGISTMAATAKDPMEPAAAFWISTSKRGSRI